MAEQEKLYLQFILQASTRQAKLLLKDSTPRQIQAVGEVSYNILHGDLEPDLLKDLKQYRTLLRQLIDKSLSVTKRRQLITRRAKAIVEILRLVEGLLP